MDRFVVNGKEFPMTAAFDMSSESNSGRPAFRVRFEGTIEQFKAMLKDSGNVIKIIYDNLLYPDGEHVVDISDKCEVFESYKVYNDSLNVEVTFNYPNDIEDLEGIIDALSS